MGDFPNERPLLMLLYFILGMAGTLFLMYFIGIFVILTY